MTRLNHHLRPYFFSIAFLNFTHIFPSKEVQVHNDSMGNLITWHHRSPENATTFLPKPVTFRLNCPNLNKKGQKKSTEHAPPKPSTTDILLKIALEYSNLILELNQLQKEDKEETNEAYQTRTHAPYPNIMVEKAILDSIVRRQEGIYAEFNYLAQIRKPHVRKKFFLAAVNHAIACPEIRALTGKISHIIIESNFDPETTQTEFLETEVIEEIDYFWISTQIQSLELEGAAYDGLKSIFAQAIVARGAHIATKAVTSCSNNPRLAAAITQIIVRAGNSMCQWVI